MSTRDDDKEQGHGAPDGSQRSDEWGKPLQNEYGPQLWEFRNEFGTFAQRVIERLAELSERGKSRDADLKAVRQRQGDDFHKLANDLQIVSGQASVQSVQTETLNKRVEQLGVQMDGADKRLGRLEVPFNKAAAEQEAANKARDAWRAKMTLWGGYLAIVGAALWTIADPLWRALAPTVLQRFMAGKL